MPFRNEEVVISNAAGTFSNEYLKSSIFQLKGHQVVIPHENVKHFPAELLKVKEEQDSRFERRTDF